MEGSVLLDDSTLDRWLAGHPLWTLEPPHSAAPPAEHGRCRSAGRSVVRVFEFPDFARALSFAVCVGMFAERKNHHPDLEVGWGRVKVRWTTHDAGGICLKDIAMAESTDELYP